MLDEYIERVVNEEIKGIFIFGSSLICYNRSAAFHQKGRITVTGYSNTRLHWFQYQC